MTEIDEVDVINCSIERNESRSVQDILSLRLEELLQTCTRAKYFDTSCRSTTIDTSRYVGFAIVNLLIGYLLQCYLTL